MNSLNDLLPFIIKPFQSLAFFHKKKVFFLICSTAAFLIFLFPFGDLSFFAQDKINQALKRSGTQVSFSDLNFNFFPLGIKTSEVQLTSTSRKPLEIDSIVLTPNLPSLLKLNPGGSISMKGLLGGDLKLDASILGQTEEKQRKFSVEVLLEKILVQEVLKLAGQNLKMRGHLSGNLEATGEESFREQPKGDFKLNIQNLHLPQEINTKFGNIPLPKKVIWKNSNLFGKIEKGKILIETGTLGTKNAPVNGRYKGYITCSFSKGPNGALKPNLRQYDIKVDLELDRDFETKFASNFTSFIKPSMAKRMETPEGGARYLFEVSGNMQFNRPPSVQSISSF